jgi:hypothetical protein
MIVQILTENSVGKYKDCGSGSDNSPEAQQVAKHESVGSGSSPDPHPLGLIKYLNPRMLGLEACQTYVHLDISA